MVDRHRQEEPESQTVVVARPPIFVEGKTLTKEWLFSIDGTARTCFNQSPQSIFTSQKAGSHVRTERQTGSRPSPWRLG
jgi:hypothetical protein